MLVPSSLAFWNDEKQYRAGKAYVFRYDSSLSEWLLITSMVGENEGDMFGRQIALSYDGSVVAVAAMLNDYAGFEAGHVKLYEAP